MRKLRAEVIAVSVAGEAEQMASVVNPLVYGRAGEQRSRALLSRDEVQSDQEQHCREDQPRRHLTQ